MARNSMSHCGVPQCNSYKTTTVSMHEIPKSVINSKPDLAKWSTVLKMGKPFPKYFVICSKHFEEKVILKSIASGKTRIAKGGFPTKNLPVSSIVTQKAVDPTRKTRLVARLAKKNVIMNEKNTDDTNMLSLSLIETDFQEKEFADIGIQCDRETVDKAVQANIGILVDITSLWNNNHKLFTMTGIPSIKTLDVMVYMCEVIRPHDNCVMKFRGRILLTMHKLKNNCSFTEIGITHQISDATAKRYFSDTIQLLALGMKKLIYWQSIEENKKNLPKYFKNYPNVRTVLDCTEFKTVASKCLCCRICTYSRYKGGHTLKVLIGVSPSGAINYLSKVATGKSTDKAIFILTDLLTKFKVGDAVMVDKGFLIADELANAGVEMIRPDFLYERFSKEQVERSTKIASARVHVERRIARLKQTRILSDRICSSMTPYIDDIMIVLCALSNLGTPILDDNKF